MPDTKSDLELLNKLVNLDEPPMEKKGAAIKNSLKIDKASLKKIEGITNPYILIEGDRTKAIELATYIYLEKSTVYSDLDLREKISEVAVDDPFKKIKKNPEIYLQLYDAKKKMPYASQWSEVKTLHCCSHHDFNYGSETDFFLEDDWHVNRTDYYQWEKNEHKNSRREGKTITGIRHDNTFKYLDWEKSYPKAIEKHVIYKGEFCDEESFCTVGFFDQLRLKNTIFLLDFMKGEDIKERDRLLGFARELYKIKKGKPGFLIVHVDTEERFPGYFLDLFDKKIPLGKGRDEQKKVVEANIEQFIHSDDYSSVCIRGMDHTLTENQAKVIKMLHETLKKKVPYLRQTHILEQIDIWSKDLRKVFQHNLEAFKDLIVADGTKGTVRLNIDQQKNEKV